MWAKYQALKHDWTWNVSHVGSHSPTSTRRFGDLWRPLGTFGDLWRHLLPKKRPQLTTWPLSNLGPSKYAKIENVPVIANTFWSCGSAQLRSVDIQWICQQRHVIRMLPGWSCLKLQKKHLWMVIGSNNKVISFGFGDSQWRNSPWFAWVLHQEVQQCKPGRNDRPSASHPPENHRGTSKMIKNMAGRHLEDVSSSCIIFYHFAACFGIQKHILSQPIAGRWDFDQKPMHFSHATLQRSQVTAVMPSKLKAALPTSGPSQVTACQTAFNMFQPSRIIKHLLLRVCHFRCGVIGV